MAQERADAGVVVAAAGGGRRFGARKQFLELGGRPLLYLSLDAFSQVPEVREVAVVLPPDALDAGREVVDAWRPPADVASPPPVQVVPGGERRQDSVLAGVRALDDACAIALVHDAARPLVRPREIRVLLDEIRRAGAAVLGTPCHDSVKRVRERRIVEELARDEVWTVQTPQGAARALLIEAYANAPDRSWTDEASALRHLGVDVVLVEGSRENIKITRPGDEALAERILAARTACGEA